MQDFTSEVSEFITEETRERYNMGYSRSQMTKFAKGLNQEYKGKKARAKKKPEGHAKPWYAQLSELTEEWKHRE